MGAEGATGAERSGGGEEMSARRVQIQQNIMMSFFYSAFEDFFEIDIYN